MRLRCGCVFDRGDEGKRAIERLKKQERNLIYLFKVGEYDKQLLEIETRKLKQAKRKANITYEELKNQRLKISQLAEQMESIETYCEWASQNLENLDFDQKRLVLEALDVQVVVDGRQEMIRGFLPIGKPALFPVSSTLRHRPGLGFAPE